MVMDAWRDLLAEEIAEHQAVLNGLEAACGQALARIVTASVESLQHGGKIMWFGNGGSAADAQHLATELTVRYLHDRPAIAGLALTTDTSTLTAAANDLGFERVFERQIEALGRAGDVAMGITTSGKSPNVTRALSRARAMGIVTCGWTGTNAADLAGVCDHLLLVPSTITARIQEMHILMGHAFCRAVEAAMSA